MGKHAFWTASFQCLSVYTSTRFDKKKKKHEA